MDVSVLGQPTAMYSPYNTLYNHPFYAIRRRWATVGDDTTSSGMSTGMKVAGVAAGALLVYLLFFRKPAQTNNLTADQFYAGPALAETAGGRRRGRRRGRR